ncbi:DUF4012 domain-containing protein [Nocardioides ferulae]|uniref:DUF4012 domain-containing protein n=1 Tax=Nocardioides ferulae TaxID=2340821 RepID=UPI000EB0271A|nr:DUF4012 domain-containing protein [Nocardioides ferulae]
MLTSRAWRVLLLLVVGVVLVLAGYAAWVAYGVSKELDAVADDGERLKAAVSAGDEATARDALDDLQRHSEAAADSTSGTLWGLLEHLPVFGDDAEGVAVASSVVADLSRDGLPGLVTASTDLEGLLPRNGRVPVAAVRELRQPVGNGQAAFADAAERLAEPDSGGFDERLRTPYRKLTDMVTDASRALTSADTALAVLPTMLGADEPKQYLLVFQNNAEIRTTGGLPGAAALLEVTDGAIEMTQQATGGQFGETPEPVLPLTDGEREIYGDQLGRYFLDANFTPDFPRTADLMRTRWEQEFDHELDGVLMLDTVSLAYLLEATGPIDIGEVTLTAENAVDELLHGIYLREPDPAKQDLWFAEVARTLFDRLSGGVGSPSALVDALSRAAGEGRMLVHSFDETEQGELAGTEVAGELITDPDAAPQVGFYVNDATGSKMSYFLRYDVQLDATYCQDGRQGLTGHATLTSTAPKDAADLPPYITGGGVFGTDPGRQTVVVRLYGPVGGEIKRIALNGEPNPDATIIDHDGRPVYTTFLDIGPGEHDDLEWTMTTGEGQGGNPRLTATPGIAAGSESRTVASACG